MKLYKDEQLTELVDDNVLESDTNSIVLGIVDVGKSEVFDYWLYNDGKNDLVDIVVSTINNELEILSYPIQLKAKESSKLSVKWTPSTTVKKGLKANVMFKVSEIVGPE